MFLPLHAVRQNGLDYADGFPIASQAIQESFSGVSVQSGRVA